MSLDDHISVTITRDTATLSLPGFGTPMVLSKVAEVPVGFTERLRYYTSPAAAAADGWSLTSETYLELLAAFAQTPRPPRVAVGRGAARVAQVTTLTPTVLNAQLYTIDAIFDGDAVYGPFTYTSDGSATANEIVADMITDINGTAIKVTASGTTTLILTADVAGVPFTVTETDANWAQVTGTPNVGIAEDIAAIEAEQSDWYGLLLTDHDAANILIAAASIEAMTKLFIAQTAQAAVVSATYNSGTPYTDVASTIKSRSYERTAVMYHATATERAAAAWMGKMLPQVAGSATWKFKTLSGVAANTLSATQRANLLSKNANGYESVAGRGITYEATVGVGEFIDVIHGVDRLHQRMQQEIFTAFLNNEKIDYTQAGIQLIADVGVRIPLQEAAGPAVRLIASSRVIDGKTVSPGFTVSPPSIEDISSSDRAARTIPASNPIRFEATLAGAIHKVTIVGTVSA